MNVIFRVIWKNINKNKLRSFLIIFTLILITILTFISIGTKNCTENIVKTMSKKYVGDSDILIQVSDTSKNPYFGISEEKENEDFQYVVDIVDMKCTTPKIDKGNESIILRGIDPEYLQLNYKMNITDLNTDNFYGKQAIVGKNFAKEHDLEPGDSFTVKTEGKKETLTVYAVVEEQGLFLQDGEDSFVVVPLKYMQSRFNIGNEVNKALIKLKDPKEKSKYIDELKDKFSDLEVSEAIVQSDIDTAVNNQTSPYKVITIIVILLAIVIISYIFKIISLERIPIIGTLRSLGANKNISLIILLTEALYYSIAASTLGCILGIFIMKIILNQTIPESLNSINIGVTYSYTQFMLAILVTVLVAILGAIIPTLKISKLPIKIILIIPYVVNFIVNVMSKLFKDVGSNMVYLSINNFRNNKNILSNIILLAVSLSTFILVNSITSSVVDNKDDLYRDNARFHMFVWYESSNSSNSKDEVERLCTSDENITDLYTTLISYNHSIHGTNYKIEKLQAGDTNEYFNYWNVNLADNKSIDKVKNELNSGRNIIITSIMKDRLDIKLGDIIPLYFGNKIINYKVIAFMDSVNTNGNNAIISEENFLKDVEGKYNKQICINVKGDINSAKEAIYENLNDDDLFMETIDEMEVKNYESYRGIYTMLKVLSAVVFLVSIIGIVNNQLINYIQRKRYFSIERSIGMSKKQLGKMLLIESVCGGIIGGIIALGGGNLLIYIIPNFLKANGQVLNISYSFSTSILAVLLGIVITIICSIMIIIKSSKLSIIESIRYE